jgi:hypothetical protein
MTLSSCGFQLRGQATIPYKSLFVETTGYSKFANDLERAIRSGSKTKIAQDRSDAEAVLKIIGESQENYILALSAAGRVLEFDDLRRYRGTRQGVGNRISVSRHEGRCRATDAAPIVRSQTGRVTHAARTI